MSNVEVVEGIYEALGRGDVPAILRTFAPDVEWRLAEGHPYEPEGTAWIGPAAVGEKFFLRSGADWDGFTLTPSVMHDAGDAVVVECRYTGVFRANGNALDAQVCHIWRLRDGRVSAFQQFADTAHLQEVMTG
jgi:ketosteroid isomerase-like protein